MRSIALDCCSQILCCHDNNSISLILSTPQSSIFIIFYFVSGVYGPAKYLKIYFVTITVFLTLLYLPVFWSLLLWLFQYDHFPLFNKLKYIFSIKFTVLHKLPDFVKAQIKVYIQHFILYCSNLINNSSKICYQPHVAVIFNIFALHKNKHLILAFKSIVKRDQLGKCNI